MHSFAQRKMSSSNSDAESGSDLRARCSQKSCHLRSRRRCHLCRILLSHLPGQTTHSWPKLKRCIGTCLILESRHLLLSNVCPSWSWNRQQQLLCHISAGSPAHSPPILVAWGLAGILQFSANPFLQELCEPAYIVIRLKKSHQA
jgi:hypothetical protein